VARPFSIKLQLGTAVDDAAAVVGPSISTCGGSPVSRLATGANTNAGGVLFWTKFNTFFVTERPHTTCGRPRRLGSRSA